jgi:hypothetical protein
MSITTIALLNAFLAALVVSGLAAVMLWPLLSSRTRTGVERIERQNEELRAYSDRGTR